MKNNKVKKAVVINGLSVLILEELKKQYVIENKKTITYDAIISKALMKISYQDLLN